ncbi:MAG: flagellar hook-length control protein FliK [Cyanobacteria bacterium REEB65]|nr:flagellar hook-length control protein FliK [Cyanobacteria bacterium REEB65]
MDAIAQNGLQVAPANHPLTAYDSPNKPQDDPQAKARQAVQDEASHPFIHYLAQFVPGLLPRSLGTGAAVAGREPPALAQEPLRAANDLVTEGPSRKQGDRLDPLTEALGPQPTQLAFLAPLAPVQPSEEPEPLSPVAPAGIPPVVLAEVQRLKAQGMNATQLRVQLDPPHLGKVQLEVTYAQQRVSVNVVAATQQAKSHLDLQLSTIRNILQAHQLQTGELKVVLGGKAGPQGGSTGRDGSQGGTALQQPLRRRRRPKLNEDLASEKV